MTCTEIDELAGAIALGALPPAEGAAVREHLATCGQPHDDVRSLSRVATLLLSAAPPVEPSPGLRERILAAARADLLASDEREAGPMPTPLRTASNPPPPLITRTDPAWWQRGAWGAAAAAVLIAAGLGAWNMTLRRDLDRTETQLAVRNRTLAGIGSAGSVLPLASSVAGAGGALVRGADGSMVLVVHGLTHTPGKTYQVWALQGDTPRSLGVFDPEATAATLFTLPDGLTEADAVAITVEPGPRGSALPTSQPIMQAAL